MTEREEQANRHRLLFLLHQLAGHVINSGYMIGIYGMAQAKTVSSRRHWQQQRVAEGDQQRNHPQAQVEAYQQSVDADNLAAQTWGVIIQDSYNMDKHTILRESHQSSLILSVRSVPPGLLLLRSGCRAHLRRK